MKRYKRSAALIALILCSGCVKTTMERGSFTDAVASDSQAGMIDKLDAKNGYYRISTSISEVGPKWDEHCQGVRYSLESETYGYVLGLAVRNSTATAWNSGQDSAFIPILTVDYSEGSQRICNASLNGKIVTPVTLLDGEEIRLSYLFKEAGSATFKAGDLIGKTGALVAVFNPPNAVMISTAFNAAKTVAKEVETGLSSAINTTSRVSKDHPDKPIYLADLKAQKKTQFSLPLRLRQGDEPGVDIFRVDIGFEFRRSIFSTPDMIDLNWNGQPAEFFLGKELIAAESNTTKRLGEYFIDSTVTGQDLSKAIRDAQNETELGASCDQLSTRFRSLRLSDLDEAATRYALLSQNRKFRTDFTMAHIDSCLDSRQKTMLEGARIAFPILPKKPVPLECRTNGSSCAKAFSEKFDTASGGDVAQFFDAYVNFYDFAESAIGVDGNHPTGGLVAGKLKALKGRSACTGGLEANHYYFLLIPDGSKRPLVVDFHVVEGIVITVSLQTPTPSWLDGQIKANPDCAQQTDFLSAYRNAMAGKAGG